MPTTDKSAADKFFGVVGAISFITVYLFVLNLANAVWVMLALGIAHHQWPLVPAFGYWASYVLLNGLLIVTGAVRYHQGVAAKQEQAKR